MTESIENKKDRYFPKFLFYKNKWTLVNSRSGYTFGLWDTAHEARKYMQKNGLKQWKR